MLERENERLGQLEKLGHNDAGAITPRPFVCAATKEENQSQDRPWWKIFQRVTFEKSKDEVPKS